MLQNVHTHRDTHTHTHTDAHCTCSCETNASVKLQTKLVHARKHSCAPSHPSTLTHTNTEREKNTPLHAWRLLCQSHSRYSHLSKERDRGYVAGGEERERQNGGVMMKKREKGEKENMRRAEGGEEACASNKYVITRHGE